MLLFYGRWHKNLRQGDNFVDFFGNIWLPGGQTPARFSTLETEKTVAKAKKV